MKTSLIAVILLAASAAFAADPVVVVNSATSVTVDGVPSGSVVDVLANVNKPNIRARLLDALMAYEKSLKDAVAAATVNADAAKARVNTIISGVRATNWGDVDPELKKQLDAAAQTDAELRAAKRAELKAELDKLGQ